MPSIAQDTALYIPTDATLARLVECAKTAAHDDAESAKRIHRAAALVEAGAVRFEGTRCTVKSGDALYPITDKCPCPDMSRRGTPCKHLYGKWLAVRLAREKKMAHSTSSEPPTPPRSIRFVASLDEGAAGQRHGITQVWQDGTANFTPYDGEEIALTNYQIVYQLLPGREVSQEEAECLLAGL